ncbi:hypothetical protein [Dyella silvatica]|uniref:hypothetical protein n=1 Tax=Dyella silvatica TaxID=2992128 RepID=UPI002255585C|nr:hypothetical protein [Dyella silvatica]
MKKLVPLLLLLSLSQFAFAVGDQATGTQTVKSDVSIRTERYPRPPYSGATYFIYEKDGKVICTKLAVCDKFDACESTYTQGSYKAPEDVKTGDPYGATPAVLIPKDKLPKHVCLTKFSLLGVK